MLNLKAATLKKNGRYESPSCFSPIQIHVTKPRLDGERLCLSMTLHNLCEWDGKLDVPCTTIIGARTVTLVSLIAH